ncbi:class I SAM-dependent methyltransferase [archaeon]|nr:MAG: class I SAM-dependent methyltransferase [archaeon]
MSNNEVKPEFWENAFIEKKEMWGMEPSPSAVLSKDYFLQYNLRNILVPGSGYGRNAQVFKKCGMTVTGIEISQTAINMAKKHYGDDMVFHHGSVSDMPFDHLKYDGIFCYGLIHLLDSNDRIKLIQDCYHQLTENGHMIFVAISKTAPPYGKGTYIEKDRYENAGGVKIFYYDTESIQEEFGTFGLVEVTEIIENFPFYIIKCNKCKK